MGGLTGSSGGLSPEQTAQLTAMLKATKQPATSLPATLLALGRAPQRSGAFGLAQDARMTVLQRQGYKATVATDPIFGNSGQGRAVKRNVVTGHGSVGDAGFGTSLSKPVITGAA